MFYPSFPPHQFPVSRLSEYSDFSFVPAKVDSAAAPSDLSRPLLSAIGFKPEPVSPELKLDLLSIAILEQMPQGVTVISSEGSLLYINRIAHQIGERFSKAQVGISFWQWLVQDLPQMVRKDLTIQDVQPVPGQVIRLQWIPVALGDRTIVTDATSAWLLLLEDRNARLLAEMRQEQQRYSLTEREAQIWVLLKLDHSYQDIADQLGISLNTVKTHVKNVYVKRRNHTDAPVPILFP